MAVFVAGILLFVIAFLTQIIVWRVRLPRRQLATLAGLLIATPIVAVALGGALAVGSIFHGMSPFRFTLVLMFYFGLAFDYLIVFSAIEADSPTLTMIALIHRSGAEGMQREELLAWIASQDFPRKRLEQMLSDGMVVLKEGRLAPGRSGRHLATVILFYRQLIGRTFVGG